MVVVEIGSQWLKIAEMSPAKGGVSIAKLHLEQFESLGSPLSDAVKAAFRKLRIPSREPVVACLPRQLVTTRILELPSTDPDEIADMVDLQIGKLTPYSPDEIMSDYRLLGPGRDGYSRVLLAIVQRSVLRQRFYVLEGAGIEVAQMTVGSEGIANWGRAVAGGKGTAVLDIDAAHTDLTIFSGGSLVFTKGVLVGADQLLEAPDEWQAKLVQEVASAVDSWHSEAGGGELKSVIVTGAGVNVAGLDEALGLGLDIKVQVVDPLKVAQKKPGSPALGDDAYAAVSVTALAGMGMAPDKLAMNMIPDVVALKKNLIVKAKTLTRMGMLLAASILAGALWLSTRLHLLNDQLAKLESELGKSGPQVEDIQKKLDVIRLVEGREDGRLAALNLLDAIQQSAQNKTYVSTVTIDRESGQVTLEGSAPGVSDISRLANTVKKSPGFGDAKPGNRKQIPGSTRYQFQVICQLAGK